VNTDVMFSSASDNWATPQALYDQYHADYGFTLDAAADETNHKCDDYLGPGGLVDDALTVEWTGYRVWLNPPYSRATDFLAHAARQSLENDVGSVILLPSRTDTKWFHNYVWYAPYQKPHPWVKAIQFLKGRVKFVSAAISEMTVTANSAPFPSLVVVLKGDW
jgi:site-specific DNA-methyltransferase (adenine-specific)